MISKETFIKSIEELEENSKLEEEITDLIYKSKNPIIQDFGHFEGLIGASDETVVRILDEEFDTDLVSYFCWDLDFGKDYKEGCVRENDGTIIDISTPHKLYDYLTSSKR